MADTILTSETDTLNPLLELAERVEAGERCDQYALLAEALIAIRGPLQSNPRPGIVVHNRHWFRFKRMLDAEAYESAAMTLIPEGWALDGLSMWPGSKSLDACRANLLGTYERNGERWHNSKCGRTKGSGATPANALTAACLRAHASSAP